MEAILVVERCIIGAALVTGGDFAVCSICPEGFLILCHIAGKNTRPCDLGWVEHINHKGKPAGQAFLNIASFGLSGVVADKIYRLKGSWWTNSLYVILRALASPREHVRVSVDDNVFIDEPLVK